MIWNQAAKSERKNMNISVTENSDERILKIHIADLRLKAFLSQRSEYLDEENDSLDVVFVDEDDM